MERIILSNDATYCNSAELSNAIKCPIIFRTKDVKGMWKIAKNASYGYNKVNLRQYDEIIIAGAISLDRARMEIKGFDNIVKLKKTKIILTDNFYRKKISECNKLYKALGLIIYIFPSMMKYCKQLNPIPYCHPFNLKNYPIKKNKQLTICHTPYHSSKLKFKGSDYINKIVTGFPVKYDFIMGKSWQETLKIRSCSHISIDAITAFTNDYINNIGKSGIEGCWLKSAVISTSEKIDTEYFPAPPIVNTTIEKFPKNLAELIYDNSYREKIVRFQREWAEKYTNYEFVAKHITR